MAEPGDALRLAVEPAARLLGESVEAMIGRPAASLLPPRIRTIEDVPFVVSDPGLGVLANDTDIEGSPLTAQLSNPPVGGALVLNPTS